MWKTLLTSSVTIVANATARHLGLFAGWSLVIGGLILHSPAAIILGGAIVFYFFRGKDS
jgi:hypothetical protein